MGHCSGSSPPVSSLNWELCSATDLVLQWHVQGTILTWTEHGMSRADMNLPLVRESCLADLPEAEVWSHCDDMLSSRYLCVNDSTRVLMEKSTDPGLDRRKLWTGKRKVFIDPRRNLSLIIIGLVLHRQSWNYWSYAHTRYRGQEV